MSKRELAESIATRLFTNANGDVADRLVLMDEKLSPRDLGGWCYGAMVDQVERILSEEVRDER